MKLNPIIYYISNKKNPPTPPFTKGGRGGLLDEAGLTLIEVLVAIAVLTIGLLGVAVMQYMAIAGNAFGREMHLATELAQERLEIVKSTPYASVISGNDPNLSDPDPSRYGGLTFRRTWWVCNNSRDIDVVLTPNDPCNPGSAVTCTNAMNNVKAIAVRVCWLDRRGGQYSVTLNRIKWNETATP